MTRKPYRRWLFRTIPSHELTWCIDATSLNQAGQQNGNRATKCMQEKLTARHVNTGRLMTGVLKGVASNLGRGMFTTGSNRGRMWSISCSMYVVLPWGCPLSAS